MTDDDVLLMRLPRRVQRRDPLQRGLAPHPPAVRRRTRRACDDRRFVAGYWIAPQDGKAERIETREVVESA
ncbi:MAG: hypothetical protein E6G10_03860 [Actinobacteria bacterium]|nr:MAG: hypothetical protein E6G10_03860 [Actinomycetota bacterium]